MRKAEQDGKLTRLVKDKLYINGELYTGWRTLTWTRTGMANMQPMWLRAPAMVWVMLISNLCQMPVLVPQLGTMFPVPVEVIDRKSDCILWFTLNIIIIINNNNNNNTY